MNYINLLIVCLVLYGLGLLPGSAQIEKTLDAAAPWIPLLVACWLLAGAARELTRGVIDGVAAIIKAVVALISFLLFLILIAPVMVADIILLGPLADWMFKYQLGTASLVALSGLALYLVGGATQEFVKKYLKTAIIVGIAVIAGGYFLEAAMHTRRLIFTVEDGRVIIEPARSIKIKGGDHIRLGVFGQITTAAGERYSPQGNLKYQIGYQEWYRSRGEMEVLVARRGEAPKRIPLDMTQVGVSDVYGFDVGFYANGYYLQGEVKIPDWVKEGRMSIGFFGIDPPEPSSGIMRVTLQLNPEQSFAGRMFAQQWYAAVLVALLIGGVIFAGVAGLSSIIPDAGLRSYVPHAAIIALVATLVAANNVGLGLGGAIGGTVDWFKNLWIGRSDASVEFARQVDGKYLVPARKTVYTAWVEASTPRKPSQYHVIIPDGSEIVMHDKPKKQLVTLRGRCTNIDGTTGGYMKVTGGAADALIEVQKGRCT